MPSTLMAQCQHCDWNRIGKTEGSVLSFDDVMRGAQTHANREDHEVALVGYTAPEDKEPSSPWLLLQTTKKVDR